MATADVGVTIARPVEDVFAVLTDPTLSPKWAANAISGELLTDGPPRVGKPAAGRGEGHVRRDHGERHGGDRARAEPCGGAQADQRLVGRHRPNEVHLHGCRLATARGSTGTGRWSRAAG